MNKMLARRRIAVKLSERFRSFSTSFLYDYCRNFTKRDKHNNNEKKKKNTEETPSLLVNYGGGFLQVLTSSTLLSSECRPPVSIQFPSNFIVCGPTQGLFCLYSADGEIALWNPATGDMKNLPAHLPCSSSDEEEIKVQNVGFGFDSSVNDYKIVRHITRRFVFGLADNDDKITHQIQVYSLQTKQWKEIPVRGGEIISRLPLLSPGLYADGACYWTIPTDKILEQERNSCEEPRLIYFLFAEEEFHIQTLSAPVPIRSMSLNCLMDNLNGYPAAICYLRGASVDFDYHGSYGPEEEVEDVGQVFQVWVWMRNENAWVYQTKIDPDPYLLTYSLTPPMASKQWFGCTPLCLWKNKGLVLFDSEYHLIWYEFETNNVVRTNLSLLGTTQWQKRNREKAISLIQALNFPEISVSNPW